MPPWLASSLLLLLGVLMPFYAAAPRLVTAQSIVVAGYVEDAETSERLAGATVYDATREYGAVTNAYGFFTLALPADTVALRFSYVGYRDTTLVVDARSDRRITVRLQPQAALLDALEVVGVTDRWSGASQIEMTPEQIETLPMLLGEVDVLKALQLMPGVQGGTDGSAGIYVRGGSPDQNLILLDGAPVYNVSHLFGFFSVFNSDAIERVNLVKGGFPARYGGRLSSVVEITMKEGNLHEFAGTGSVGLLASRLTLEGPIVPGRSSFVVSGRRTTSISSPGRSTRSSERAASATTSTISTPRPTTSSPTATAPS